MNIDRKTLHRDLREAVELTETIQEMLEAIQMRAVYSRLREPAAVAHAEAVARDARHLVTLADRIDDLVLQPFRKAANDERC